jgi:hypothetical protein
VDTHGFTHFAMALAKLTGFDLCPQLASLKDRKLYLPRGLEIPDRKGSAPLQTLRSREPHCSRQPNPQDIPAKSSAENDRPLQQT